MSNVDGYTAAGDSDTDGNTMSEKTPLLLHTGDRNNTVWDYASGARFVELYKHVCKTCGFWVCTCRVIPVPNNFM